MSLTQCIPELESSPEARDALQRQPLLLRMRRGVLDESILVRY